MPRESEEGLPIDHGPATRLTRTGLAISMAVASWPRGWFDFLATRYGRPLLHTPAHAHCARWYDPLALLADRAGFRRP